MTIQGEHASRIGLVLRYKVSGSFQLFPCMVGRCKPERALEIHVISLFDRLYFIVGL